MSNYKCKICEQKFKFEKSLKEHILTHQNSNFSCEICSRNFTHRGSYTDHLKSHTNTDVKYECAQCPCFFKNGGHLNAHIREVHENLTKVISCGECKINFESKSDLRQHKIDKHPSEIVVFTCMYCNKRYSSKNSLKWHVSLNHNKDFRRSKCPYCPSDFKWPHHLKTHIRKAHIKNGQVPTDLLKNGLTSIRRKKNDCVVCDEQFDKKFDLMMHLKYVHKQVLDIYKCCVCEACFSIASSLIIHLENHKKNTNGTNHKCSQCHPNIVPIIYESPDKSDSDDNDSRTEIEKEIIDFEISLMEYEDIRELIKFRLRHAKRPKRRERVSKNSESDFEGFDSSLELNKSASENGTVSDCETNDTETETSKSSSFTCDKCDVSFETELSYLSHQTGHLSPNNLDDDKATEEKMIVNKEIRIQLQRVDDNSPKSSENGRRYACKICGHTFRLHTTLLEHIRLSHGATFIEKPKDSKSVRRNKYHCKNCNEKFSTLLELSRHMKVESRNTIPQNIFRCKICKTTFNNRSRYSNHIKFSHAVNRTEIRQRMKKLNRIETDKNETVDIRSSPKKTVNKSPQKNTFKGVKETNVTSTPVKSSAQSGSPKRSGAKLVSPKRSGAKPVSPRRLVRTKTEKVYECGKCEIFFNSKLVLLRHISDVHM